MSRAVHICSSVLDYSSSSLAYPDEYFWLVRQGTRVDMAQHGPRDAVWLASKEHQSVVIQRAVRAAAVVLCVADITAMALGLTVPATGRQEARGTPIHAARRGPWCCARIRCLADPSEPLPVQGRCLLDGAVAPEVPGRSGGQDVCVELEGVQWRGLWVCKAKQAQGAPSR